MLRTEFFENVTFVNPDHIVSMEAKGSYCRIQLLNGTYVDAMTVTAGLYSPIDAIKECVKGEEE